MSEQQSASIMAEGLRKQFGGKAVLPAAQGGESLLHWRLQAH